MTWASKVSHIRRPAQLAISMRQLVVNVYPSRNSVRMTPQGYGMLPMRQALSCLAAHGNRRYTAPDELTPRRSTQSLTQCHGGHVRLASCPKDRPAQERGGIVLVSSQEPSIRRRAR